jgi:Dolichyl-phosphate-mannose-protein mannosyltransferase
VSGSAAPVQAPVLEATEPTVEVTQSTPSRFDPIPLGVGVVAAVVYALHGFDGLLTRDPAVYGYAGQQVVEGVPPYEGIMNRAGPLAHLLPAVGVGLARAVGVDEVLGMRLLFLVFAVACVCLVYLLGRRLFDSRLAGLAAAAAFLSFNGFIEYASNGPREKTPMVLLLLCTLLAVVGRRWFAAGVALSIATLTWQPVFFAGLAAVAVAVFVGQRSGRLRAVASVVVGGLVPVAVCLAYFASVGAVGDFLDGFVLINAQYTESSPLTLDLDHKSELTWNVYGVSVWVMLAGLAVLVAMILPALRRPMRRDPTSISVLAFGVAILVGFLWSLRDFDGWSDTYVFLPMAAIGIGAVANEVAARLRPRVLVGATVAWVVVAVTVAAAYAVTGRERQLDLQRESVGTVLGELPPDASILSIGAPQPLVLTGATNPSQYQMFVSGMETYVDRTWPRGLDGYAAWIRRERPTAIALGSPDPPYWLEVTMARAYRRIGGAPNWVWYVHRSVGPAVVADLRSQLPDEPPLPPDWW